jgi:gliding motility-associated-like protein
VVTVNVLPTITGTLSVCAGSTTQLTGSASAALTTPWVSASTGFATVNVSGLVTGVSAGSSVITYSNSDGCSIPATITVKALPVVAAGIDASVPTGTAATLNATVTGTGPFNYSWTPSAKFVDPSIEDPTTISLTTTTPFILTATSTTTTCFNSDTVAIAISGGLLTSVPTAMPAAVCPGASVQLLANAGGGSGSYTYAWTSVPVGFSSTLPNPIANPIANTNYSVAVSDGLTTVNTTVAVNVNAIPSTPTIVASGPTAFCTGGSVSLTSDFGTGYLWSNGATTQSILTETAGNYTVQVTNASGCQSDASIATVVVVNALPATPTITAGGPTTFCAGGNVSLTSSLGTTYLWSNAASSASISPTTAGSYTVQVTNAAGCLSAASLPTVVTVNALPATPTITPGGSTTLCAGGSLTLTSSIESGYLWSTGATTPAITVVASGNYSIQVTNAENCSKTNSIAILAPVASALTINSEIKIDNNLCFGDSLGEIRVLIVSGGVSPYEYSVNGGLNYFPSSSFQKLAAGNYQTVVRDSNGCIKNGNLNNISQPPKIIINSYSQVNVSSCFGNNNGEITIHASGGAGAISYTLNGIANNTTGIFTSVSGGNHLVTVTDSKSCQIDTTVTLTRPSEIIFSGLTVTDVLGCSGESNGAINAIASGGAGSYNYSFNGGAFQSSGTLSDLSAGSYQLSVSDANTCTKDTTIIINEPAPVRILSQTSVNVSCKSDNNGSIITTAEGGTAPYLYTLNPGAISNTTGIFNSLAPGAFTVTVNDNKACQPVISSPITITEPTLIGTDSVITNDISCAGLNDAEIHIFSSGGTSPYTYSIDNGASFGFFSDFTNLTSGTYHLSVIDSLGCSQMIDTLYFTEPLPITFVSENKLDIVTCASEAIGEVNFEVSGGTGIIDYSLDLLTWQPTGNYTGLNEGNYTVTARDQHLCSLNSSLFAISAPDPITAEINSTQYLNELNKGTITISNASGGSGILTYSISGPTGSFSAQTSYTGLDAATYPVVIKDENSCTFSQNVVISSVALLDVTVSLTNSNCKSSDDASITMVSSNASGLVEYSIDDSATWVTSGIFTDLKPGTYKIFLRDDQNRYFKDTVELTEPLVINIFGSITSPTCSSLSNDGAIDVSVNGGTLPYTYHWASGEITQDISNLSPGSYTITVSDSKLCSNENSFTLTPSNPLTADAGADTILCFGQEYTLNGQGGSVFSWSPAEGLSDPNIANPVFTVESDTRFILTVIGFNDCTDSDTVDVSVRPALTLSAGNDTLVIKDQPVTLQASGSEFTSYSWLPITGLATPDQVTTLANPLITTNYIITAISEFGCSLSDTVTVKIADRLIVYNAFSPNNDTQNDYFEIEYATLDPDILVEVFTRWGEKLFSSIGYSDEQRWDGTYKGKDVPMGTYYYVIVPYKGAEALTGPLTIVR